MVLMSLFITKGNTEEVEEELSVRLRDAGFEMPVRAVGEGVYRQALGQWECGDLH